MPHVITLFFIQSDLKSLRGHHISQFQWRLSIKGNAIIGSLLKGLNWKVRWSWSKRTDLSARKHSAPSISGAILIRAGVDNGRRREKSFARDARRQASLRPGTNNFEPHRPCHFITQSLYPSSAPLNGHVNKWGLDGHAKWPYMASHFLAIDGERWATDRSSIPLQLPLHLYLLMDGEIEMRQNAKISYQNTSVNHPERARNSEIERDSLEIWRHLNSLAWLIKHCKDNTLFLIGLLWNLYTIYLVSCLNAAFKVYVGFPVVYTCSLQCFYGQ